MRTLARQSACAQRVCIVAPAGHGALWAKLIPSAFVHAAGMQMIYNLGLGVPQDAIVQDRAFNTQSSSNAYLGFQAVESVAYDPRESPDRATVVFATSVNGRRLPPKRAELYINNTWVMKPGHPCMHDHTAHLPAWTLAGCACVDERCPPMLVMQDTAALHLCGLCGLHCMHA